MKVGEWANPGGMYRDRRGKMMMPAARARMLGHIRTFFHDLQEWGWIPVRFSPERVFRAPRSLTSLVGPEPRIVADDSGVNYFTPDRTCRSRIYQTVLHILIFIHWRWSEHSAFSGYLEAS